MSNVLRFTVRFLDPEPGFHGKGDGGEPEWPPSPLRLFQALVDASANRWRELQFNDYSKPALEWLQQLDAPVIVAPAPQVGVPFRIAVPNNDLDVWAGPVSRGNVPKKQPNELKTMKTVRRTRLLGATPDDSSVSYLFRLPPGDASHLEVLRAAARSVTHLGWGIDMVAADADVLSAADADALPGHRWRAVEAGGVRLRVPVAGTLADLVRKHGEFLGRLSGDGFKPVSPLTAFGTVGYHSAATAGATDPGRPVLAFEIHRTIADQESEEFDGKSRFRPYHPVRDVARVAGMVRHAAAEVARDLGWSESEVAARVLGHGGDKEGQATSDDRLLFLPLPSITPNGVAAIRRVLVVGPPGCDLAPLRRRLNGWELTDEATKEPAAMLSYVAPTDKGVTPFAGTAATWTTVTPVVLPGYDDPDGLRRKLRQREDAGRVTADEQKHLLARLDARVLALVWKAFAQAGWTPDALAGAEVEYRGVGWLRGLDLAGHYDLPPLKYPRYHLRVRFARRVRGPLAVGAGRYRGLGLFAKGD